MDRNLDTLEDAIARLICILELEHRYREAESGVDAFLTVFGKAALDRIAALQTFLEDDLGLTEKPTPKASDVRNALRRKPGLRVQLIELFDTYKFCLDLAAEVLAIRARTRTRSMLAEFNTEIERIEQDFEKDGLKAACENESLADRLAILFYLNEGLAQRVASVLRLPFPFPLVLDREMDCVTTSRFLREGNEIEIEGHSAWDRARNANSLGLALSGGGIRSATFNLGILQGLAEVRVRSLSEQPEPTQSSDEKRLLQLVDYLSTVSGGGYIGAWLHAWILRSDESAAADCLRDGCPQRGIDRVVSNLSPGDCPDPESDSQQPIKFLRRYAKYLTPKTGFFSADTWSVVTIWLRNTLLNLIILALGLGAVLLIPRILHGPFAFLAETRWSVAFATVLLLCAICAAAVSLSSFADREHRHDRTVYQQKGVQLFFVLPLLFAAFSMAAWFGHMAGQPRVLQDDWGIYVWVGAFSAVMFFVVSVIGRYYDCWYDNSGSIGSVFWPWFGSVVFSILSGALAAALSALAALVWVWWQTMPEHSWLMLVFGTPLLMVVFSAASVIHIGLMGANLPDDRREWWGRAGAYITLYGLGWIVISAVALWGPQLVAWVGDSSHQWIGGSGLTATWLLSTVSGILAGTSKKTGVEREGDGGKRSPLLQGVAVVTPYIFILGLLIYLSFGIHWITLHSPYRARRVVHSIAVNNPKGPEVKCNNSTQAVCITMPKQRDESNDITALFDEAEDRRAGRGMNILVDGEYPDAGNELPNFLRANELPSWQVLKNILVDGEYPLPGNEWPNFSQGGRPVSDQTGELPSWHVLQHFHNQYLGIVRWWWALIAAAVSFGLAFLLAWRVNVNEFSMHHFYRNRLVRCYLGASQKKRRPNRFTGLDPCDDRCLGDLTPKSDSALPGIQLPTDARPRYSGPYAIVNTTLNLVQGDELAWQERKGQSFVFTPEFCGYAASLTEEVNTEESLDPTIARYGFRPTRLYAYPQSGIHIGSVMAISGAAQSPNEGSNSSPASAFLMTVFNVRLGWWSSNTRHRSAWRRASPALGLFYLFKELLASTNNKSAFLYLSDGGHFENLGVYELIRRRCRYIIACDASQDGGLTFEDLGNAIRKCRTDFGAEIEMGVDSLKKNAETGLSRSHCVVGTIRYRDSSVGKLVYIKTTLTGDEPSDVVEYRSAHTEFPHETTVDQFFTESQFESYRKLGYHIIRKMFGEGDFRDRSSDENGNRVKHRPPNGNGSNQQEQQPTDTQPPTPAVESASGKPIKNTARSGLDELFDQLEQRWYPSSKANETSFTRFAEKFEELYERLRKNESLKGLDHEFYPEISKFDYYPLTALPDPEVSTPPAVPEAFRSMFFFCTSVTQLMEDVYLDLKLEDHYDHPDNHGWISCFQRWTASPTFRLTWRINSSLFGTRFRSFMKERFDLTTGNLAISDSKESEIRRTFRFEAYRKEWSTISCKVILLALTSEQKVKDELDPDVPVGFAIVEPLHETGGKKKEPELVYLWISKPFRRMGIAGRALDVLEENYQYLTMSQNARPTEAGDTEAYKALRTKLEVKTAARRNRDRKAGRRAQSD